MNSLSLILRILAIVAALAAAALFFVGKGKLAEQQTITQKAEAATQAVQAELTTANEQVSTLEANLKTEREALADAKRKLESIRSEMYTAKQEVSRSQQQLNEAKRKIQSLENEAKSLRNDLIKTEQGLTTSAKTSNAESEIAQLNERVAELEKANAELKENLAAEKNKIVNTAEKTGAATTETLSTGLAYKNTFTPSVSAALPVASIGSSTTIQSVSAKDGLIVLANNSDLGLSPGIEATIVKDLKAIGKIQVVNVSNDLVVANILPGAKTNEMRAGTTISLMR
jgi:flagellar biosynthesis chaperone FliJ